MKNDIVISVSNISKQFNASNKIFSKNNSKINALNNISLNIKRGEIIGIIGRNGSGKSTFLKVLGKVTKPYKGSININGIVVSAIEVASGFNLDLSASENLKILCGLWKVNNKEYLNVSKQIIEFSNLAEFMDMQIKKFSTGMIGRLASSILIHLKADIYLFDEVLNGTDEIYKRKLHNKISELQNQNKTIFYATHNINDVLSLCNRAFIIEKGELIFEGNPFETIVKYRKLIQNFKSIDTEDKNICIKKNNVIINNINFVNNKLKFTIEPIELICQNININFIINNSFDLPIAHSNYLINEIKQNTLISCAFPNNLLNEGVYTISIAISINSNWIFLPRVIEFELFKNENSSNFDFLPGIFLNNLQWNIEKI